MCACEHAWAAVCTHLRPVSLSSPLIRVLPCARAWRQDKEFQELQFNFMSLQYDDLFSSLEARMEDSTLLLLRATWLRKRHSEEEHEELLPQRGNPVPEEARVNPSELRRVFAAASGSRGYRKVDLPFITLSQFWRAKEHPDPEEETLQGVIGYLQARWEEVTLLSSPLACPLACPLA